MRIIFLAYHFFDNCHFPTPRLISNSCNTKPIVTISTSFSPINSNSNGNCVPTRTLLGGYGIQFGLEPVESIDRLAQILDHVVVILHGEEIRAKYWSGIYFIEWSAHYTLSHSRPPYFHLSMHPDST